MSKYKWKPIDKHDPSTKEKFLVILHVDLGTEEGTYNWLANGPVSASYHYYINKAGEITQFVSEQNDAWHSGRVHKPIESAAALLGGSNPNDVSIGICYEGRTVERSGKADGEYATKDQVAACVELVRDIKTRHDIKAILAHKEVTSYKPSSVLKFRDDVVHNLENPVNPEVDLVLAYDRVVQMLAKMHNRMNAIEHTLKRHDIVVKGGVIDDG